MGFGKDKDDVPQEGLSKQAPLGGVLRIGAMSERRPPRLWLTSASGKAIRNLKRTVLNPVPVEEIIKHEPDTGSKLKYSGYKEICVWGLKPTEKYVNNWNTIEPGDYVLFLRGSRYILLGRIVYPPRVESPGLASALWASSSEDAPWSLIFFFESLTEIDVDYRLLNSVLGYNPEFRPEAKFGFLRVREDRIERLIDKYGSIEEALTRLSESGEEWIPGGLIIARLDKQEDGSVPAAKNPKGKGNKNFKIFDLNSLIKVLENHRSALEGTIDLLERYRLKHRIGRTIVELDGELVRSIILLAPSTSPAAATVTISTGPRGVSSYQVELIDGGSYLFRSLEDLESLLREIGTERQVCCNEHQYSLSDDLLKRVLEIMEKEIDLIGLLRRTLQTYLKCFTRHCANLASAYVLVKEGLIDTEASLHEIVRLVGRGHGIEVEGDEGNSEDDQRAEDKEVGEADHEFIETGLVVLEAAWRLSLDGFNISSTEHIIREIRRKNGENYPVDPDTVNRILRNIGAKGRNSVWNIGFLSAYRFAELREAWLSKFRDN